VLEKEILTVFFVFSQVGKIRAEVSDEVTTSGFGK